MPTPDHARTRAERDVLAAEAEFARLAAQYPAAHARFWAYPLPADPVERTAATWALASLRGAIVRALEAAGRDLMAAVVGDQIVTASLTPMDGGGWRLAVAVEADAACLADIRGTPAAAEGDEA